MRLVGAAAPSSSPVLDEVGAAIFEGRAVLLWCDGEDLTALIGGEGEAACEVARWADKLLPGVPS